MSKSFYKLLEESLRREHGGPAPRSVEQIAQRVGSELRAKLRAIPQFPPDRLTEIEMAAVDLTIQAVREALFRERTNSGSPDWDKRGFGTVSQWHFNGNGRKS